MKRIQVVYVFVYNKQSDQVLLVKNKNHPTWSLPGGRVEGNETLHEACVREVYEETGLSVEVNNVVSINEMYIKEHHAILTTFNATLMSTSDIIHIHDVATIEQARWISLEEANQKIPHYGGIERFLDQGIPYTFHGELAF
ncbi:NUDIX domain-containing protein [Alkalihalobacillus sp. FSL W8-0930]